MTSTSVREARRRALDHWFVDGALELVLGLLFVGCGLLVYLQGVAPNRFWTVALVLWTTLGAWVGRRWVSAVKMRRSMRDGYVSFRAPGERRASYVTVAVAAVVLLSVAVAGTPLMVTIASGAFLTGALLLASIRTRNRRLVLVTVTGAFVWYQALQSLEVYPANLAAMWGVTGIAFLIMAARARWSRHSHPVDSTDV